MTYDVCSALGNEVRVKLLLCLSERPKNVSELIAHCGLAQSAVSQHLSKLKSAKLVAAKKHGQEIVYSLKYPKVAEISKLIIALKKEVL